MRYWLVCLLTCAAMGAHAQGINFFHGSWDEALKKAKAENRYIFLDTYTSWCGPCKMMARETFTDASVGTFFNKNFLCVKLDLEDGGDGTDMASKYSIRSIPTLLFFNPKGQLVHRAMGYQDPDGLIELGGEALRK